MLRAGTKKESNAAYVDAVQATASVGAERQYLAEFITSSDEHSTGQKVLLFLDYLSTALFALIGAQYAGIAGMNVVGATLVGVVGGVGGGTVTGALTGANAARGVFWMRDPRYLLLSTVVAVATYYLWPKYLEWTGPCAASLRRRRASSPSSDDVGRLRFDFAPVRAALRVPTQAATASSSSRAPRTATLMPSCPRTRLKRHYDKIQN